MPDFRCEACGHSVDAPQHKLGCPATRPRHDAGDVVEKVAAWLYAFDGDPEITDEQAEETREVYRGRATTIVVAVRDHDALEAPDA